MKRSLYEITDDFIELESSLDAIEDGEDASVLLNWMSQLTAERQQKIDAYCWVIKKLESEAENARELAAEFTAKKQSRLNKVDILKSAMRQHMESVGTRKLIGNDYTVAIQANGGSFPVEIDDIESVPSDLRRVEYVPLKTEIRAKLEAGEYVPGARLVSRGESVRIK